jgi:hypothetical protein
VFEVAARSGKRSPRIPPRHWSRSCRQSGARCVALAARPRIGEGARRSQRSARIRSAVTTRC